MRLFATYLIFLSKLAFISYGAILPHQGRVLISGSAYEGTGLFRFALVDQSGAVVWNHEGGVGDPQNSLSIPVEKGFYQCRLGDTSIDGMAELPDAIFTPNNPLKLRIWFDDGTNGLQRLGQDQNLMMAPYAMTSPRSESEKIAMRFADEIIRQASTSDISVDELIERISSFAQQATQQGTITKDMLPADIFAEMNKTVQMFNDSQSMITDLNRTLNQAVIAINRPLTTDMLPDDLLYDINHTKMKYEDSFRLIGDLNKTLTLLGQVVDLPITKDMLPEDLFNEMNKTVQMFYNTESMITDLNRTLNQALVAIERPITRDMLPESVRNDLNRTITKSMLAADVLADLNRTLSNGRGSVTTEMLSEDIIKYLRPEIVSQTTQNSLGNVYQGKNISLSLSAEGKFITYQWQKDGVNLEGETASNLNLGSFTPLTQNGTYRAIVANDFGSVLTEPVTLFRPVNPKDLNSTAPLTIKENLPAGTFVGQFTANDPDDGNLTYNLEDGESPDHALFRLESNGSLYSNATFDFELNKPSYSLMVAVRDQDGGVMYDFFTVSLVDEDEEQTAKGPFVDENGSYVVAELHEFMDQRNYLFENNHTSQGQTNFESNYSKAWDEYLLYRSFYSSGTSKETRGFGLLLSPVNSWSKNMGGNIVTYEGKTALDVGQGEFICDKFTLTVGETSHFLEVVSTIETLNQINEVFIHPELGVLGWNTSRKHKSSLFENTYISSFALKDFRNKPPNAPGFVLPNEELDLRALDEFMKSENHQYKKQANGETLAEVSYDSSWDISRDRRADKYPSFNGVIQSNSPMQYNEVSADDPNGYNDILHSDIQGPFGDNEYFLDYDERTLSTEQKDDEIIAINGTEYPAYVYEIKEKIIFSSSIPPGDPEGMPIAQRTDYYEDRTRTLWVNKDKGLLKWTEENILYSETYGLGSSGDPHIDETFSYQLILDSSEQPNQPTTHTVELNSSVNLEMIWVEPGTFTMGSPESEEGRSDDETQHQVILTEGFYLGKYEVTQAQYKAIMTGNADGLSADPSNEEKGDNRPVSGVSWNDVQVFLSRLNKQQAENIPAGWSYVLPTEAQWEYACRAGTTTAYSWGDSIDSSNVNDGSSEYRPRDVGQYPANPWGFFDMHGNVYEWTADVYAGYASGAKVDPFNSGEWNSDRVVRGGGWPSGRSEVRSAFRHKISPSLPGSGFTSDVGFRIAYKFTGKHTVELNSSVVLEMIWVEPGTFTMGSPTTEAGRQADREDEHNVSLTKGFYLGKYVVTQAQYKAVMAGNEEGLNPDPSNVNQKGSSRPVDNVSWNDVQVFVSRLNDMEQTAGRLPAGWKYVLPTEAQWEYACRAGTTTAYSWGNDINSSRANYNFNIRQTVNVGQYAANPWGFFDMHGNVYEWTADWYQAAYPTGNPVVDPTGPSTGSERVFRGGSMLDTGDWVRSAARAGAGPSFRDQLFGFRLAFQAMPADTANPELTLAGNSLITHSQGIPFIEPGVEAHDARDGNITDQIVVTGLVDMNTTGTYILTYSVADAAGNNATATRTVTVVGNRTVDLNASVAMDMIWCPPGTFTMGSPVTEVGRSPDETEHNVTLSKGFYLGKYEVTQAQYEAVMKGNPQGLNPKPSWWSDKPSHPVEDIPYADIQVFLSRLSDIEELSGILPAGWKYVLPTEAQWEYACRAGTKTAYSWGDDINASRANYNNPSGQTVEVGQYDPNPWGFYDMHGNVHEWTSDFHYNSGVYKGGSWQAPNSSLRSAAFGADSIYGPFDKANNRGFRVSLQKQD